MKRLPLLLMFLLQTTKTAVFLKAKTVEAGFNRPVWMPIHSTTGTQIWKRSSQNERIFNGPQTIQWFFCLVHISK